eukprot:COSAG02_NODE_6529_length_3517_cov_89.205676_1_plen_61_part_00
MLRGGAGETGVCLSALLQRRALLGERLGPGAAAAGCSESALPQPRGLACWEGADELVAGG